MPRDIVIIAEDRPDPSEFFRVAAGDDPDLRVLTMARRTITQLCDDQGGAVLSIGPIELVQAPGEVDRLLPGVPAEAPVWWAEAWAPEGTRGEQGVRIARAVADRWHGVCVVQDIP
jgi:hypothetical protein